MNKIKPTNYQFYVGKSTLSLNSTNIQFDIIPEFKQQKSIQVIKTSNSNVHTDSNVLF